VWLKHWSEANQDSGSNLHVGKYIGVYFALGFGYSLLILVQTLLLWIFCSIEVSLDENVQVHKTNNGYRHHENSTSVWHSLFSGLPCHFSKRLQQEEFSTDFQGTFGPFVLTPL
jgi:hypothetical protein